MQDLNHARFLRAELQLDPAFTSRQDSVARQIAHLGRRLDGDAFRRRKRIVVKKRRRNVAIKKIRPGQIPLNEVVTKSVTKNLRYPGRV